MDTEVKQSKEVLIMMKLKTISCITVLSLLSSLGFSAASDQSGINLYSEASAKESISNIVSMQLFYKFPLSLIANLDPTGCSIKRCVIGVLCVQILCSIGLCVFS